MKHFVLALFALLALLQYRLWFGDNGLGEFFQLKDRIAVQKASNETLIERNEVLKEEITDLKSGTEALEERARNELGLVELGETFIRVVDDEARTQDVQDDR